MNNNCTTYHEDLSNSNHSWQTGRKKNLLRGMMCHCCWMNCYSWQYDDGLCSHFGCLTMSNSSEITECETHPRLKMKRFHIVRLASSVSLFPPSDCALVDHQRVVCCNVREWA